MMYAWPIHRSSTFIVAGLPMAQPRAKARAFATGKLNTQGKEIHIAQVYNPKGGITQWKYEIKECFKKSGIPYYDGPIGVEIIFYFPRPAAYSRETDFIQRKGAFPPGCLPMTKRPDRDNLDKAVLDSLKGIAWKDDNQVFCGPPEKWYCALPGHGQDVSCAVVTITHYLKIDECRKF
jgi:Holliday junction resolvase RusA-like endonuclease